MSEEASNEAPAAAGELTDEQQNGIFAAAATAAAAGEAPPAEENKDAHDPATGDDKPADDKGASEDSGKKSDDAAAKAAADQKAASEAAAAAAASAAAQAKADADKKAAPTPAEEKPFIDRISESIAGVEFDDPAGGEGAKIKGADLEKEYPQMTGYAKALVQAALAEQAKLYEMKLANTLMTDPTLSNLRQIEIQEQVATLLDSVATGDDGISNAAEIQAAALKANWVQSQPAHIRAMALESTDPRDIRFVLERAAEDLKIDVKRGGGGKSAADQATRSDNRVLAARSALRGTSRQAAPRSGNVLSMADADAEFERTVKALKEGKQL